MASAAEKKALIFLAAVACLGGGVRAVRYREAALQKASLSTAGIDRQLLAVDSAREAERQPRGGSRRTSRAGSPSSGRGSSRAAAGPGPVEPPVPAPTRASPLDLDRATATEIEALPGIGPVLAGRIIADRKAHGPFGSTAAFSAVKGIGPALLSRLDTLVTFSGPPRPPSAAPAGSSAPKAHHRRPRFS